jgi:hypothetical protein
VYKIREKADELKEEHFVAMFYSMGFLNNSVFAKKDNYYEMLLRILTPEMEEPIFFFRNMLCLSLAIYGVFIPWMEEASQNGPRLTRLAGFGCFRGDTLCIN